MPALAIKSCLVFVPLLKCSAADADAIVILFLPYHLCFGQMSQTRALLTHLHSVYVQEDIWSEELVH